MALSQRDLYSLRARLNNEPGVRVPDRQKQIAGDRAGTRGRETEYYR